MALETSVTSVLLENKRKRDAVAGQSVVETVPPVTTESPATVQTTIKTPSDTSVSAPAENSNSQAVPPQPETPPVIVPTEQTVSSETPPPAEEEFKWDAEIPDVTVEKPSAPVDLKKLGSALNLEVNSEEDFISKVKERLDRQPEDSFQGVPDSLKQAVEIAKKGGDWLAYTGATALDATKLDPIQLFDREYARANAPRFQKPDGSLDVEKLDEALDSIDSGLKILEGNRIKNSLIVRQEEQKAKVLAQVVAQQEQFQKSLALAATELSSLLPREDFGVTIEPKHSSFLYEGIAKGTLVKKHLGDIDPATLSKLDGKKLMRTIALAELGKNISQLQRKQGEIAGKKALLQSTQNVQLGSPSYVPQPNTDDQATKSTADMLREQQAKVKPKNSL